jgi:hypothetical protein
MITLRISWGSVIDICKVVDEMADKGLDNFDCQDYRAVVKGNIEYGLCINFYDEILEKDFKTEIWEKLCNCSDIKISCGYVESPYYKGCIWNWPGVFRESNCP